MYRLMLGAEGERARHIGTYCDYQNERALLRIVVSKSDGPTGAMCYVSQGARQALAQVLFRALRPRSKQTRCCAHVCAS